MKMKNRLLALMLSLISLTSYGQVTEGINFQAQARGNDGKLIDNKTVKTRISILEISATTSPVYIETQISLTDQMGLYNLLIGKGTAQTGNFQSIDWSVQPKYIRIELDIEDGSGFKLISTFQLATVPYAFYAKTAKQAENYTETDPVFNNSVAKGITQSDTLRWNAIASENWSTNAAGIHYNMGKVGIGTNSPRSLLDVVSSEGNAKYSFNASNTNSQGQAGATFWNNNGGWLKLALLGDQVVDGAAFGQSGEATSQILSRFGAKDMLIGTLNDQSLILGSNNVPRLSILNDGKIGVGTTTPFQNLDVRSDSPDTETKVAIGNSDHTNYIEFFGGRTNDPNPFIYWKGNSLRFASSENGFAEKMIITEDGKVGIGLPNPSSKLSVAGLVESTTDGYKFPDGTIQSTATTNSPWQSLPDDPNSRGIRYTDGLSGEYEFSSIGSPSGVPVALTIKNNKSTFSSWSFLDIVSSSNSPSANRSYISLRNPFGLYQLEVRDTTFYLMKGNEGSLLQYRSDYGFRFLAKNSYFKNRIGIGTTNFPIDVATAIQLRGIDSQNLNISDLIQFNDENDIRRWHLSLENNTDLNFAQTGISQDRLYLKNDGNIGIGTRQPLHKLDVRGAAADDGAIVGVGNGTKDHSLYLFGGRQNDPNPFVAWSSGDPMRFVTVDDSQFNGFTERMRISDTGNLGIGTNNPKSKMQVTGGDVYVENIASGVILKSPNGQCWRVTIDNTGNLIRTSIVCP